VELRRSLCTLLAVGLAASVVAATGSSAGAGGKAPTVKIVVLAETTGESAAAVPYYDNGAKMAAEELGDRVEYIRIPAPVAPAGAENAFQQARDQDPDAIIGFPASSQGIAVSESIKSAGIPFFTLSSGEQLVKNGPNGANNLFLIRPVDTLSFTAQAEYAIDTLKKKKIGLVCVDNATGVNGCNAAKKVIQGKQGVEIVAERSNSTTATDLTEQATAMRDATAILDFNFPNPLGVISNQLVDNGINVPHVDGASAGIIAAGGVVQGKAATNLKGTDDCVPVADKSSKVKKWVSDYESMFGDPPIYSAAQTYDMVKLIAEAAKKAGSTSPDKLNRAIASISYDGICADYKTDNLNVLQHTANIVKFNAQGKESIAKPLRFQPGELPGVVPETTAPTTAAPAPSSTP
jgi:branched-chain amino acid transport system substrate-binding protein